jgi:uncharacterized protein (DUF2062 family)
MPRRFLPPREKLVASRWLRPVAHRLHDDRLWHLSRESVARGTAIGLFFGFLIPVAQILFAVACAIALRGNVAVSAASTLVTNPFTFAPIYWAAHRVGSWVLTPGRADDPAAEAAAYAAAEVGGKVGETVGRLDAIWQWVVVAGAPLVTGLAIFACVGALAGYLAVLTLWRAAPAEPAGPSAGHER